MKKFILHSITVEDDEQKVVADFNDLEKFNAYMCDLNMDLSREDDDGYSTDCREHIHIFYNVMLKDNEIYGFNERQYRQMTREV